MVSFWVGAVMAASAAAATAAAAAPATYKSESDVYATIVSENFAGRQEVKIMTTTGEWRARGAKDYWVATHTTILGGSMPSLESWTTSRDCPGLVSLLGRFSSLPAPRPAAPEQKVFRIGIHGTRYTVSVDSTGDANGDNRITYTVNEYGPQPSTLAAWVKRAEQDLELCWKAGSPP